MKSRSNAKYCPSETPFYDGTQCIKCPNDKPYFNLDDRVCQSCDGTFVYNADQRECIDNSQSVAPVKPSTLKMSGSLFSHQKVEQAHFKHHHLLRGHSRLIHGWSYDYI